MILYDSWKTLADIEAEMGDPFKALQNETRNSNHANYHAKMSSICEAEKSLTFSHLFPTALD